MSIQVFPLATLLFIVVTLSNCGADTPGIDFIGVGYDLVYGNPDGSDLTTGGTDPGIKATMRALKFTYSDGSNVPEEVNYKGRLSCTNSTTYEMFNGAKSYQKKCATQVSASAGGGGLLWDFSFSASVGFEEANQETNKEGNVFFDENVMCNRGTAGYRLEAAKVNGYSVTRDFAASVCALPDKFSKSAYKKFLAKWGTHLITKVVLGTRYTKRYKMSKKQFFSKAMKGTHSSVSAGGGGMGFHASVSVSVDKFKSEAEQKEEFGESYTEIRSGTPKLPSPIKTEITPIYTFIKDAYFREDCPGRQKSKPITKERIAQLRENMKNALEHYPSWVGAPRPYDPKMTIPLTWPVGFYGLPKTASGCPHANNFEWNEGSSLWFIAEIDKASVDSHFPADAFNKDAEAYHMYYCVKTANDGNALLDWPEGNYCILKKGKQCPPGFASSDLRLLTTFRVMSKVTMQYAGTEVNVVKGTVPEITDSGAVVDRFYCCRDDGFASNEIFLPTEKPFYLFPVSHECQRVRGMKATKEYLQWSMFTKLSQSDVKEKLHPYFTQFSKEFYCYYEKA